MYENQRKIKLNAILLSSLQGFSLCSISKVFHVLRNAADSFTDAVTCLPGTEQNDVNGHVRFRPQPSPIKNYAKSVNCGLVKGHQAN